MFYCLIASFETNITGNSSAIIEKPAVELVQLFSGILLRFALLATVNIIAIFVYICEYV
jgi:hypothetical protein